MGRIGSLVSQSESFQHAAAVTPADAGSLPNAPARVYVGGTGNVTVITSRGDTVTLNGVPAGTVLPLQVRQVKSTGTTATNMVALY